jgi:hypothetical protein
LTDAVAEVYQGFDLHGFNGDESDELPLAATYVIDQNNCLYVLDAEYTNRAEAKDILALDSIKE